MNNPANCRSQYHRLALWHARQRRPAPFYVRQSAKEAVELDTTRQYHWIMAKHQPWQETLARAMLRIQVRGGPGGGGGGGVAALAIIEIGTLLITGDRNPGTLQHHPAAV